MVDLAQKARELRKIIFKINCDGGGGHVPTAFSVVELLLVLYNEILKIDPQNPDDPGRDRFILSKGHAATALYAVLSDRGFFDKKHLFSYGRPGTILGGHPDMYKIPGVEASTGALGHGFPFAMGMALAAKLDGADYKVYTILGDGECQEGTIWESALFAPQKQLDNLTAIIDYNKYQAMDRLDTIVGLEPLADKWRAFGWEVREIDGHDFKQIGDTLRSAPFEPGKPNLIIAHTIKGKGVSYMVAAPIWHFRCPNEEEKRRAEAELE